MSVLAFFECLNCGEKFEGDITGVDPYGEYVTSNQVCPYCGSAALRYVGPSPSNIQPHIEVQDPYVKCRNCANSH